MKKALNTAIFITILAALISVATPAFALSYVFDPMATNGYGYGTGYGYGNYGVMNSGTNFNFDENTWGAIQMANAIGAWDTSGSCSAYSHCGSHVSYSGSLYGGYSSANTSGEYGYYDWRSGSNYDRYFYGNGDPYTTYGYNYGDPYARYSNFGY